MLDALGWTVERTPGAGEPPADLVWAASGAMALTGWLSGPPLLAPAPLASCARGAVQALRVLAGGSPALDAIDGARLLGERASCLGLGRRGAIAPGGTCRLVRARDGWLAVNLARVSDVELLPAWLDLPRPATRATEETWAAVRRVIGGRSGVEVVERARLLGMPVALAASASARPPWFRRIVSGAYRQRALGDAPLVLDLSTLWAGPLAASLLGCAGARVIKVESTRRPDGARRGPRSFYDLLNGGKESVALDFSSSRGRAALCDLIARADIVVESARPRAFRQLGIDASTLVRSVPGLVWVGITGYGRGEPESAWVAFGDDAGAAAGLATATGRLAEDGSEPLFCGDAIADPLTGAHAAAAALAAWRSGAGCLLDLALRDVAAHVLGAPGQCGHASVRRARAGDTWEVALGDDRQPVSAPSVRPHGTPARPLGADTATVLADLGVAVPA